MTQEQYQNYIKILRSELIPAMGCTEPIAVAFAAASACTSWLARIPVADSEPVQPTIRGRAGGGVEVAKSFLRISSSFTADTATCVLIPAACKVCRRAGEAEASNSVYKCALL